MKVFSRICRTALIWAGIASLLRSRAAPQDASAYAVADSNLTSGKASEAIPLSARLAPVIELDRVIDAGNRVYNDLLMLTCREAIERFASGKRKGKEQKLDVITSTVTYDGDFEKYSNLYKNDKPLREIKGLDGAWSEGEFGTVLGDTLKALKARPLSFISHAALNGADMTVFDFEYVESNSPWEMTVLGTTYSLPFHLQVWVSSVSGEIFRIVRVAEEIPSQTGIANVTWTVDFGMQPVSGKTLLLPSKAIYSVSYVERGRHEWNLVSFSEYRRYSTDVVIHYH